MPLLPRGSNLRTTSPPRELQTAPLKPPSLSRRVWPTLSMAISLDCLRPTSADFSALSDSLSKTLKERFGSLDDAKPTDISSLIGELVSPPPSPAPPVDQRPRRKRTPNVTPHRSRTPPDELPNISERLPPMNALPPRAPVDATSLLPPVRGSTRTCRGHTLVPSRAAPTRRKPVLPPNMRIVLSTALPTMPPTPLVLPALGPAATPALPVVPLSRPPIQLTPSRPTRIRPSNGSSPKSESDNGAGVFTPSSQKKVKRWLEQREMESLAHDDAPPAPSPAVKKSHGTRPARILAINTTKLACTSPVPSPLETGESYASPVELDVELEADFGSLEYSDDWCSLSKSE